MPIIVTGASGFIGQYFVKDCNNKFQITTLSLQKSDWRRKSLVGVNTIIHLAGMAHRMETVDPALYFKINHELTMAFAQTAKKAGVMHFIFISTIKVYGENKTISSYNEKSVCEPSDPYGKSKWKAEQDLMAMNCDEFIVSIVRPPLVYGSNVKGNLQNLLKLIRRYPLVPFGNINNKRSMVYVGNLTALIRTIILSKKSGVFLAGDATPHSTTRLVDTIIEKAELKTKNLVIPFFFRKIIALLRPDIYQRLFGDLIIENTDTNQRLGFTPPFSFEEGITEMVKNN